MGQTYEGAKVFHLFFQVWALDLNTVVMALMLDHVHKELELDVLDVGLAHLYNINCIQRVVFLV